MAKKTRKDIPRDVLEKIAQLQNQTLGWQQAAQTFQQTAQRQIGALQLKMQGLIEGLGAGFDDLEVDVANGTISWKEKKQDG